METQSYLILLTDFFPPGFRSGGPSRSCFNLSVGLGSSIPVKVLTPDTDLGSSDPYPGIEPDKWNDFAPGVSVCYCSAEKQRPKNILQHIEDTQASVFYLNSMFSLPFTIYPLLFHWLGWTQGRMVLAPRGMLKPSALQFKPFKKKLFLSLFKILGWHKHIIFHATSEQEAADIYRVFGTSTAVMTCVPVPEITLLQQRKIHHKSKNSVRFAMVGRIHPIKNIEKAIQALSAVEGATIVVDVIGPFEDQAYYQRSLAAASRLPASAQVKFHGAMPAEEIHQLLQEVDFFYLLTQGENFGHAIFEALALGKPVIISDQTPWRHLESQKAGWDIALDDTTSLSGILNVAAGMDDNTYQEWSAAAHSCAHNFVDQSDWKKSYLELFDIENA